MINVQDTSSNNDTLVNSKGTFALQYFRFITERSHLSFEDSDTYNFLSAEA